MKTLLLLITALGVSASAIAQNIVPEIEFKVLLVIKRESDTYSPLFLPLKARMTDVEVANARRCFEVETPAMVSEITGGKVRLIPTVYVSEKALRIFEPKRLDSAEYYPPELLNEFYTLAKPGDYDSVGCYFLHYDTASGYKIPRAGYGVGGCDGSRALGMFAINCTPKLNLRDEIFLHEWMHGLDGFYGNKSGVKLPKGFLHGASDHGYREKPWHVGDTFRGWMEWYRDYLTTHVREGDQLVGLGSAAWKHGTMRQEGLKLAANYKESPLPSGTYPEWIYELMKGDLSHAVLGPPLFAERLEPGEISRTPWRLNAWNPNGGARAQVTNEDGAAVLVIDNPSPNNTSIERTLTLEPSMNYVFSADVRTEGVRITEARGRYAVNLYAGDSTSTKDMAGTKTWTTIVLPFTTGPKPESRSVKMAVGGFGSVTAGRALFRNVQVRKVGYPTAQWDAKSRK